MEMFGSLCNKIPLEIFLGLLEFYAQTFRQLSICTHGLHVAAKIKNHYSRLKTIDFR